MHAEAFAEWDLRFAFWVRALMEPNARRFKLLELIGESQLQIFDVIVQLVNFELKVSAPVALALHIAPGGVVSGVCHKVEVAVFD